MFKPHKYNRLAARLSENNLAASHKNLRGAEFLHVSFRAALRVPGSEESLRYRVEYVFPGTGGLVKADDVTLAGLVETYSRV